MTQPAITKLDVSICKEDEDRLKDQGYQIVNVDLNEGTKAGHNRVFLWYRKESGAKPVTRIQFSFNSEMKTGLAAAKYEVINKDLNYGVPGDHIFLWYFCGNTTSGYDLPILSLEVTKDASEEPGLLKDGWERVGCNLNRNAEGNFIYLWVKRERESFISEITATVDYFADKTFFEAGYTRVDENTNRDTTGNPVFLWYRRTFYTNIGFTVLDVSTNPLEESNFLAKNFKKIGGNLNTGAGGNNVYLWTLNDQCTPQKIKAIQILTNAKAWATYQNTGAIIIDKNLNEGTTGRIMYLSYK
nr:uncharacterized protein si:dkey-30j10.5 [Misgurnus anguillicaudatus]